MEDFNGIVSRYFRCGFGKVILKTKEVINCSDENLMPEKLKELFSFYAENGVNIENVAELFDNFETWRKEYLT